MLFRRRIQQRQLRRIALGRWLDAARDGGVDRLQAPCLWILDEVTPLPACEAATHGRSCAGRDRDPLWLPLGLGGHGFRARLTVVCILAAAHTPPSVNFSRT